MLGFPVNPELLKFVLKRLETKIGELKGCAEGMVDDTFWHVSDDVDAYLDELTEIIKDVVV